MITQYSRIQNRRGLFVDLPQPLEDGEIGQAVDERRLFIGNGQIADGAPEIGNTEILTEFSPISNMLKYTYVGNDGVPAITGPDANTPVTRSLQQTLDDRLSIKAYGAKGDGSTDDTVAINRAMRDVYTVSIPGSDQTARYREIFFPAGTYIVNSDFMYVPPFASLVGEGIDRTVIIMTDSSKETLIRTVDDQFQTDLQLGNNSALLPTNISARGITFAHIADMDVIELQRASNIFFNDCKFTNGWTSGSSDSQLVKMDPIGNIAEMRNIRFKNCVFNQGGSITNLFAENLNIANVAFESCTFTNLFQGIIANNIAGTTIIDLKVLSSHFENVGNNGPLAAGSCLFVGPNSESIVSNSNTYVNCGDANFPVIVFESGATDCISTNDSFKLQAMVVGVQNLSNECIVLNPKTDFVLTNIIITSKHAPFTLASSITNANTNISFDIRVTDSAFIDYTLKRNSFSRVGRLFLVTDGTVQGTTLGDMFTESGVTGVTFDFNISGNIITVLYSADTGTTGEFHHQFKTWLMTSPIVLQTYDWTDSDGDQMITSDGDILVFSSI